MTVSWQSVVNFLRNAGSIGAVVVGIITAYTASGSGTTGKITGGSVLAVAGAVVQWIEHHNNTKATSTPPAPAPAPKPPGAP